jgi:hypothetical protein
MNLVNPSRRQLLALAAAPAFPAPKAKIEILTRGPRHHFFGYYGIPPWNSQQNLLVCLETEFQDHLPSGDEPAAVMLLELSTGKLTRLAQTHAWNLQQGAMLHWNPLAPDREILFNDRLGQDLVTVVLDVHNGNRRALPMALAGVSHNGQHALCLNYARLARLRPVVGIRGVKDKSSPGKHPEDDGAFLMDLRTGNIKNVLSVAETHRRLRRRHPELDKRPMFFNHTVFSKDDKRFFVLARGFEHQRLESAMFSANLDGTDIREAVPYGRGISHFDWKNGREILATFRDNRGKVRHWLFEDGKQDFRLIGPNFFDADGHCSYSPDTQYIVSDKNHLSDRSKELLLYQPSKDQGWSLGRWRMGQYWNTDIRCDLHPRFSRDGQQICFDCIAPDGSRQLHIARLNLVG